MCTYFQKHGCELFMASSINSPWNRQTKSNSIIYQFQNFLNSDFSIRVCAISSAWYHRMPPPEERQNSKWVIFWKFKLWVYRICKTLTDNANITHDFLCNCIIYTPNLMLQCRWYFSKRAINQQRNRFVWKSHPAWPASVQVTQGWWLKFWVFSWYRGNHELFHKIFNWSSFL